MTATITTIPAADIQPGDVISYAGCTVGVDHASTRGMWVCITGDNVDQPSHRVAMDLHAVSEVALIERDL